MKSDSPEKAEEMLDIFSDMVLEKALRSAKYLERVSETEILCYYFQVNQAHFISIKNLVGNKKSFLNNRLSDYTLDEFEFIQGTKKYTKQREDEMYDIMQTGASLSNGDLYQKLLMLL